MNVGVLALQGAFREHIYSLEALSVSASAVRLPSQLAGLDGLIIPGGESTAIAKLMETYGFYDAIPDAYEQGLAIWGTCAGSILLAKTVIDGIADQRSLNMMDIAVRRNAFGRQIASFEATLNFAHVGPYEGVFIRAPWFESVGDEVEVLATHNDHSGKHIVAARQDRLMACSFHPELTGDTGVHRYFIEQVIGA